MLNFPNSSTPILNGLLVGLDAARQADITQRALFHGDRIVTAQSIEVMVAAGLPGSVAFLAEDLADASDGATLYALANDLKTTFNVHIGATPTHEAADATNTVSTAAAVDDATAEALVNAIKAAFNAHLTQSGVHYNNDSTNTVSTADATDQASAITLANALKSALNAHMLSAPAIPAMQPVPR